MTASAPASPAPPCPPEAAAALDDALARLGDPAVVEPLQRLRETYRGLDAAGRLGLFVHLAEALEVDLSALPAPPAGELRDPATVEALIASRDALEAPRLKLLRELPNVPGGVKFLVDLRAELLELIEAQPEYPALHAVDADMFHLLRSWFNFGFLELVSIDWETTSAAQLEKLMAYEVVHPMSDWASLRRRLRKDRLCYAFYHPTMPGEPLIFVEVALTATILPSVDRLMAERDADDAGAMTTAIFYSINATQPGLAGVSLGNSLIKTAVGELRRRYPNLRRFSTLSPVPGFGPWLEKRIAGEHEAWPAERIEGFFDPADAAAIREAAGAPALVPALRAVLETDAWYDNEALGLALKGGLLRLAHHYLARERRDGRPRDPVARFHLRNGALLYNLNHLSDTSAKGRADSYGITANYLYDPDRIEDNQHRYRDAEVVVASQLERMLELGVSG